MKNFERPVVALNEMMMSESIASICCFSLTEKTSGYVTTTVKNVLNGGDIKTANGGYAMKQIFIDYFGGILPAPSYHYTVRYYTSWGDGAVDDNGLPISVSGAKYKDYPVTYFQQAADANGNQQISYIAYYDGTVIQTAAPAGIVGQNLFISSYTLCDHQSKGCPWVGAVGGGTNQHVGSTTPHALGGRYWWDAHNAQQYSS